MTCKIKLLCFSALFSITLGCNIAQAQVRVSEETLIYNDPTVAPKSNSYVVGGSLEYWTISNSNSNSFGTLSNSQKVTYNEPGVNLFAGKGDFTVAASYRSGKSSSSGNLVDSSNNNFPINGDLKQGEYDVSLRWLMRDVFPTGAFTPYLVGGYNWGTYDQTNTLTVVSGSSSIYTNSTSYSAPYGGIGTIIPFNEVLGLRLDFKGKFFNATQNINGVNFSYSGTNSANSFGKDVTATFYYNINKTLNAQFGARASNYGGLMSDSWGYGAFFMLGASFK
jgi:hypothetical protein